MTTSLTVPVRTLVYTPFTGSEKDYAVDPRGRSARWRDSHSGFIGSIVAESHKANPARIVIPRQAGMLRTSLGKSWELDDYRFLDGEERGAYKSLGSVCEVFGITLAFVTGLNVGGIPLDMAIPAHRAALCRTCEYVRSVGATELWVDTGGDIAHSIYNTDNRAGMGVIDAAHIASDNGVALVVEYTKHFDTTDRVPTYERIRRRASDPATVFGKPRPGVPTFLCYGWNGGGCEPVDELKPYADRGHEIVAWNGDARTQAIAALADAGETAKETT